MFKEAITMVSFYAAADVVEEKIGENPNYKDINISEWI